MAWKYRHGDQRYVVLCLRVPQRAARLTRSDRLSTTHRLLARRPSPSITSDLGSQVLHWQTLRITSPHPSIALSHRKKSQATIFLVIVHVSGAFKK